MYVVRISYHIACLKSFMLSVQVAISGIELAEFDWEQNLNGSNDDGGANLLSWNDWYGG